jgi:hypothetical protein
MCIFCVVFTDQDSDKKLTLSEFISLPMGTVENQQAQDIDDDWVRERKKEFEEVIDGNHDGIVTMEELQVGAVCAGYTAGPDGMAFSNKRGVWVGVAKFDRTRLILALNHFLIKCFLKNISCSSTHFPWS